jgi:hypothetical protein
MMEKEF